MVSKKNKLQELITPPDNPLTQALSKTDKAKGGGATAAPSPLVTGVPAPEVFRNEKGELSGITINGKTFLGLKPKEVRALAQKQLEKQQLPAGTIEASAAREAEENIAAREAAIIGLGQEIPQPNVELGADRGIKTALSAPAILGGAAAGGALGAKVGAMGGTAIAPGAGTAIGATGGAIVGAAIGGLSVLFGKLALDKRQITKEAYKTFTTAKTRNNELMNYANSGKFNPAEIREAYNQNLANILEARRVLKIQTEGKIGKELSGAMNELIAVESYLEFENLYRQQLINAIRNPNPNIVFSTTSEFEILE